MRGPGQPLHFLERLSRVTPAQASMAALLARDSVLMRQFLERAEARMPLLRGAARVALPLSAEAEPAHVIVAEDGNAVTCLAPGMPVQDAPVVPHAWVAELAAELDQAFRAATALRRAESTGEAVLERFGLHAAELTAAELDVLGALVPLLVPALEDCVRQAVELFRGARAPILSTPRDSLEETWNIYVRGAHAMALGSERAFPARALVLHSATPDVFLQSRAAHGAARRGAATVDELESLARDHGLVGAEHELAVAAALHQPLLVGRVKNLLKTFRAQEGAGYLVLLQKALDEPRSAVDRAVIPVLPLLPSLLMQDALAVDPALAPDALSSGLKTVGDTSRMAAVDVARRLHRALPPLLARWLDPGHADHVPLWRTLLHRTPLRFNAWPLGTLLLSRAPRAAFFPDPRTGLPELLPASAESYVRHVIPAFRPSPPSGGAPAQPGPNSPCPCGSGKKFKKCHGAG